MSNTFIVFDSRPDLFTPTLSGGNLPGSYKFAQVHFHWGADGDKGLMIESNMFQKISIQRCASGSEHLVDNEAFPMEMHFVHYKDTNQDLVSALEEGNFDSLAVLAIFIQVTLETKIAT